MAQTLNALGEANAALGHYLEARRLFMECYTTRMTILGDKHPDTASVMKNLATVAYANKSYTEAREMALGALRIYTSHYGVESTHESIIPLFSDLGEIYMQLGNVAEATGMSLILILHSSSSFIIYYFRIGYFEKALSARRYSPVKNNSRKLGALLMSYGKALCEISSFAESDRKFSEALELLNESYSSNGGDSLVVDCLLQYSDLKRKMGLIEDAQKLVEQGLSMMLTIFGEESAPVADALMKMCEIYTQRKQFTAALDAAEECTRIRAQLYGSTDNLHVATSLQTVAKINVLLGRGEESLAVYRDSMKIFDTIFGISNCGEEMSKKLSKTSELRSIGINMATVMHQIATMLIEKGCYAEATALLERCLDMRRRIYGEEHGTVALTLHYIADISFKRGLYEEALEIHSIGRAIRTQCFGDQDVLTAASEVYVGMSELAVGQAASARDRFESCVHCFRLRFGDESSHVATILHYMSQAFLALQDYESTIIVEEKALDILLAVEGRDSALVVDSLTSIGDAYRAQGYAASSKPHYSKALEILKRLYKLSATSSPSLLGKSTYLAKKESGRAEVTSGRMIRYSALSLEFCCGSEDLISVCGAFETDKKKVSHILGLYEKMLWTLDVLDNMVEADSFAEEALDMYSSTFGINSSEMVPLLRLLGLRQRKKGDYSGALPFLEKCLWIQETYVAEWDSTDNDESTRRQRVLFLNDTVHNISDISWLLDKQGMRKDAKATQSNSSTYEKLLSDLQNAGSGGPIILNRAEHSDGVATSLTSKSALFTHATSEQMSERADTGTGTAYSLLSNLSLFLSSKSE